MAEIPEVRFKPISLNSFKNFVDGLRNLYDTGSLSRSTYTEAFGYNYEEEASKMKDEKDIIKSYGIDPFPQKPYSNQPGQNGQPKSPNSGGSNG